ncbi:unnamed protein product (macronuclear) [Paramecium tetraurelia]|uniref:Uncharacterized protein n=1 Tax=Paramecium tetraurelia TaxID=5888 RepID=A0C8C4_PARTE|nr:uncharacterized protein GSPATT00036174001 [Paramecium tetraurelia]CAK67041.1 unnamed protein product [Paramecium tetraurelia]|eukprot:XP_001434438.1 hypothetical protein (macronuclear) [Paramecium tetraurelia strain d4-2]
MDVQMLLVVANVMGGKNSNIIQYYLEPSNASIKIATNRIAPSIITNRKGGSLSNQFRYVEQSSQVRVFKIVPRNRIVQNVFKVRDPSLQTSQRNQKSQDNSTSDQQQWLGHNLQNSFQYEPESDTVVECKNKGEHYQTALISILERTDSEELKDLMRKKSFSVDNIDDNEQIRGVLRMIDMDS